jgi:hypothetical protein
MTESSSQAVDKEAPDSLKQPVWHVLVLSWVTALFYLIYWFYKNWRDLSQQESAAAALGEAEKAARLKPFKDISPMLRGIGMFVPALNIFLSLTQVLGIAQLVPAESSFPRSHPLVAAGIVMGASISLLFLFNFHPPIFFAGLLAAIPFGLVQHWLNEYWDTVEPQGRAMRHAFSVKELIVIILGGMLLGLNVAGYMIGVDRR